MTDDLAVKVLWAITCLLVAMFSWHIGRRYEVAARRQRRMDRNRNRRHGDRGSTDT